MSRRTRGLMAVGLMLTLALHLLPPVSASGAADRPADRSTVQAGIAVSAGSAASIQPHRSSGGVKAAQLIMTIALIIVILLGVVLIVGLSAILSAALTAAPIVAVGSAIGTAAAAVGGFFSRIANRN